MTILDRKLERNLPRALPRGFSLVETLVAITVLIVGVLGPLNIAARGIGDGLFARNQIVANYLAQEAIEIIVNKRHALARQYQYTPLPAGQSLFQQDGELWNCIPHAGGFPTPSCATSYNPSGTPPLNFVSSNDPTCSGRECYLIFNTNTGIYMPPAVGQNQLEPDERGPWFKRKIRLTLNPNGDTLKVVVTVEWRNKDVPKSLTIVEHLYGQG